MLSHSLGTSHADLRALEKWATCRDSIAASMAGKLEPPGEACMTVEVLHRRKEIASLRDDLTP